MEELTQAARSSPTLAGVKAEANAYVGPVPVPRDRRIYGRDREITMAVNRILFDRVLLVYSPSGAGKTSVISAQNGILHQIREEGVSISRVIRVSLGAATAVKQGVNRYLFSTLRSLDPEGTADEEALARRLQSPPKHFFSEELGRLIKRNVFEAPEIDPRQFADPSLIQPTPPLLLVFDQFEELLTLDPIDEPAKREFLEQVGLALQSRDRLALFAMREDFVAGLDPFLALLPSRLSAVLRLDFLAKKDAEDAVKKPPQEFSAESGQQVVFDDDACQKLLKELLKIRVQDPVSGEAKEAQGLYIEPLHLQVVCAQLWASRQDPTRITVADLDNLRDKLAEDLSGVDAAMASYYTKTIREIAAQFPPAEVTERRLRHWFGRVLISPDGLRLSTLLGKEKECQLTAEMLRALDKRFLIRAEQRHNMTYYEVAHDRFVEPIRKSNFAWKRDLGSFQQAAELWHENGRREDFVVVGKVLEEGEKLFSKRQAGEFSDVDRDFLDACRKARQREKDREEVEAARRKAAEMEAEAARHEYELEKANREATELKAAAQKAEHKAEKAKYELERAAQRQRLMIAAFVVVGGGLFFSSLLFYSQRQKTTLNLDLTAQKNFNRSLQLLDSDPEKSFDLLKDWVAIYRNNGLEINKDTKYAMVNLLPMLYANRTMRYVGTKESKPADEERHFTAVTEILMAESGATQRIITRDTDGLALCWQNASDGGEFELLTRVHTVMKGGVTPDGRYFIAGHGNGQVCRWDLTHKPPDFEIASMPVGFPVIALDVLDNYGAVAWKTHIELIDLGKPTPQSLSVWPLENESIRRIFVAREGSGVVVDGANAAGLNGLFPLVLNSHPQPILNLLQVARTSLAPDHSLIVFACENDYLDLAVLSLPKLSADGPVGQPRQHAFNRSDKFTYRFPALAVSGKIGTTGESLVAVIRESVQKKQANSQAPSQECFLVRVTKDKVETKPERPKLPVDLSWSTRVLAFSKDGKWLAAGFQDGTTCVWSTDAKNGWNEPLVFRPGAWEGDMLAPSAPITALAFLPRVYDLQGRKKPWLFTGQADGTLRRWDLEEQVNVEDAKVELVKQNVLPKET